MLREEAIMVLKNEQPHCGKKALFPEEKKYEAYDIAIKALEQEPRKDEVILTKEEYGELVSSEFDNGYAKGYREALEQEPKMGQWVLLDECANSGYYCSECHKKLVKEGWSDTVKKIKYCPNCGCAMKGEEE